MLSCLILFNCISCYFVVFKRVQRLLAHVRFAEVLRIKVDTNSTFTPGTFLWYDVIQNGEGESESEGDQPINPGKWFPEPQSRAYVMHNNPIMGYPYDHMMGWSSGSPADSRSPGWVIDAR